MTAGWKIVKSSMLTRWGKAVDPLNVLPEYPRPQMVRKKWLNLNGLWDYAIRPGDQNGITDFDGKILVPFPVESVLSGVQKPLLPTEKLWYRRSFEIPGEWDGQRVLLHFGAVDWQTEVWVNGRPVGEHSGGFYPFSFDLSGFIRRGVNEIVAAVWDPTDTYGQERGKQTLKPKQIFYSAVSGIWQTVWLEPVPESYIQSIKLLPDIDQEELTVQVAAVSDKEAALEVTAYDGTREIAASRGEAGRVLTLKIADPKLWSPESPFLYDLTIRLTAGPETTDEVESYFGMRKFSFGKDSKGFNLLFLNNEPLFQNGPLDQGYWPDGLYTAPTDEALRFDLEVTRQMGFNMTRKHIKVEPARWYYHCDRLGLIVWQDMPNGGGGYSFIYHFLLPVLFPGKLIKDDKYKVMGRLEQANRANFIKELKEMIDALYNVPSIGMWVIFNESWGQFDAEAMYDWLKDYDSTRCIDHASGWFDQGIGEMKSVHTYLRRLSMPKKRGGRAVIISEYGGYGLALAGHLWRPGKQFGYKNFRSREELKEAFKALLNDQVKPLIAEGLAGAVYTQLVDVEAEINGLMTYDREIMKIDPATVRNLNCGLAEERGS